MARFLSVNPALPSLCYSSGVTNRDFLARLTRRASRINVHPSDELLQKLEIYYSLLLRWNEKINLTALGDSEEALDRLLVEPLAAARHVSTAVKRMIDIGSGGGSPAIPMALAVSGATLTMVEVKVRKSAFLREAVRQLELAATVETAKVEELLTRSELHEGFQLATMRAVRVEPRLLTTVQAFVEPEGQLFVFRGPQGAEQAGVIPPLTHAGTYPLVDILQSRLTVLTKRAIGAGVPRGT